MVSGAAAKVEIYACMRGSRVAGLSEMYRMSVSMAEGRAARDEEPLRWWRGIDFNSDEKSDFRVPSGSFKPIMLLSQVCVHT